MSRWVSKLPVRLCALLTLQPLKCKTRDSSVLLLDVGTSLDFETAHLPRAKWISRGWLDLKLPELYPDRTQPIVLTCADGRSVDTSGADTGRVRLQRCCGSWRRRARVVGGRISHRTRSRRLLGRMQRRGFIAVDPRHQGRHAALSGLGVDTNEVSAASAQELCALPQQLSYFGLANVLTALVAMSKRNRGMSVRSLP